MAGRTDGLIKSFRAGAPIAPFRIVKSGGSDSEVLTATAGTGFGVSVEIDAAAGQRVDVAMSDIADVRYGGPVTREDPLTSDAQGRAVLAAPAPGVTVRIIGFATVNGVTDDIGSVHLQRGFRTG